jgi:hypothetical protein
MKMKKNNISHPETIDKAIDELQQFLDCDLYTKFRPEMKIKKEKFYRRDFFKTEKEMSEYLEAHFNILKSQIKRIRRKELKNNSLAKIWNNKKDKIWKIWEKI